MLINCKRVLREDGLWRADADFDGGRWRRFELLAQSEDQAEAEYLVPGCPVDIHCHGVGHYDFSVVQPDDLLGIEEVLRQRGIQCIATIYVSADDLPRINEVMGEFSRLRQSGKLVYLVGFALEGPLLGSSGGIPKKGAWVPTKKQWELIGSWGTQGLRYMVMSPDALDFDIVSDRSSDVGMRWVLDLALRAGIRPALGHFVRSDAAGSANCIEAVLRHIEAFQGGAFAEGVLTDHLFNDMPINFRHAWRSERERQQRGAELAPDTWTWEHLEAQVGAVAAGLMKGARDGRLTVCMNFDGEHVDHEYCRRTVRLVGASKIMAITDHTEVACLAGEALARRDGSSLLWQADGLVAAGGQEIARQMASMSALGLSASEAWHMFGWNPARFFGLRVPRTTAGAPGRASFVTDRGSWLPVREQSLIAG